jgi:hypothetical protein
LRRTAAGLLIGVTAIAALASDDVWSQFAGGISRHSFVLEGQFVIFQNGFRRGEVTWAVVRNWPEDSSHEERRADKRFTLPGGQPVVRLEDGSSAAPRDGWVYLFDGARLTTFPFEMVEDDLITFRPDEMQTYSEIEGFLREFEVQDASPGG